MTVLPLTPFDPGTVLTGLAVLLAMGGVAWRDCLTFEIDFTLLGVAGLGMAAIIATGGGDLAGAVIMGGMLASATTALHALCPGRIGQGDIWLIGFLGLAAGLSPHTAGPVLAVFLLLSILTAASYSHARGKRLFQSPFPAALPGMGAASLALALHLWQAASGDLLPPETGIRATIMFFDLACATGLAWVLIRSGPGKRERTTP